MPPLRARRHRRISQPTRPSGHDPDAVEARLLAEVASGEHGRPLAELYAQYATPLYRLGLRLLRERGPAEELVQETFVRLWQSAGRFDPEQASVRTFVFLVGRRVAVDLQRRAAARPPLASGDAGPEPASDPDGE
nr:sigma-70 family RNA polymerase sigma factor [Solirubrobacterales bacterium]